MAADQGSDDSEFLSRRAVMAGAGAVGVGALGYLGWRRLAGNEIDSDRWVPPHPIEETDTFDNEPHLVQLANGDLLLVYRRAPTDGGGHVHRDGYIVARRSKDLLGTWSEPVVVADVDGYDTRNQSVIYDEEADRVIVYYRVWDPETDDQRGEFYKLSEDGGVTWSDPRAVPLQHIDGGAPFGGGVRTSHGLMTMWYEGASGGIVEALFSQDGGQSWGDNVVVGDTRDQPGRVLTEPVPVARTENHIWTWGRDNETADFFVIQSSDGGRTWNEPEYFNPTGSTSPTPIWVRRTSGDEITAVWADRMTFHLHVAHMNADIAWDHPTVLGDQEDYRIHESRNIVEDRQGPPEDYGYPTVEQVDEGRQHILVAFYDGMPDTDIWITSVE